MKWFPLEQFGPFQVLLALSVAGLLAYGQTLWYPFVHDEIVSVQHNPLIARFDWNEIIHGTGTAVLKEGTSSTLNAYYRPLLELFYRIEYALFGLDPAGWHLFNIFLHIANGFLAYSLMNMFSDHKKGLAFAVSLFFLLHPVQTETVACISGVSNLLFAFFGLSSLCLYLKYLQKGSARFYVLSLAAFATALLAKEQAVIWPVLIFLLPTNPSPAGTFSFWHGKKKKFMCLGGYLVVLTAYFAAREIFMGQGALPAIAFNYELLLRVSSIPRTLLMYLGTIFFPRDLHYYRSVDILRPNGASMGLFLVVLVVIIWMICRIPQSYRRLLLLGAGWFGIILLPVLNIVPLINEYSLILTAEHFLYLPLIGVLLFVLGLGDLFLNRMPERRRIFLAKGGIGLLALLFLAMTLRQSTCWAGEIPLFERTVRFEKDFGRAHILLAKSYYENGEYVKAIETYRRALAIMDGYLAKVGPQPAASVYLGFIKEIHFDLAHCFEGLGDFEAAASAYLRALVVDPADASVHNNLGVSYINLGDREKAAAHFREAIALDPRSVVARKNLEKLLHSSDERGK